MSTQAQAEKAIGLLNGFHFTTVLLGEVPAVPAKIECATDFKKGEAVVREEVPRVEVGSD